MAVVVRNFFLSTFVLSALWKCSESYNLDHKNNIKFDNKTSIRQPLGQSCNGDNTRFQCATTADCISTYLECDGKEDCPDGSDEQEYLCKKFPCPKYLFRCNYGACINSDERCDGKKNCLDNSDELNCEGISGINSNQSKKCVTPAQPSHGKWVYLFNGAKGAAKEETDLYNVISFSCEPGYKLSATNEANFPVLCMSNNQWSVSELPTCQKLCPSLFNSPLYTLTCKNNGSVVPCDKATDNTILTFKCAPYYEPPHGRLSSSTCYNGLWDYIPECIPVCGEKRDSATPLIVRGVEVERGDYPWVVALYSNKNSDSLFTNICQGTLISTEIILTAAHCVTKQETGKAYPVRYFRVAAGKLYNQYEDPRDNDRAQYSEVAQIDTPGEYKGEIQNFRGDIALLKLKTPLLLSKVVQPVCYNNLPTIEENAVGVISGWGHKTSSGEFYETTKELDIPYIEDQCITKLDEDFFGRFFTSDKICIELSNNFECPKIGGSGLVFRHTYYKNRYFIHGIASLGHGPSKNQSAPCHLLMTKVESYMDWIRLKVRQWTPSKMVHL